MPTPEIIEIGKGETIVPSNIDNIAPTPQKVKCLHGKSSLVDVKGTISYLKCKECGEEWEA